VRWPATPVAVRTRLTLWYTAVLLATLLVITALSYSLVRRSLVVDLDESLLAAAQVISDTTLAPPPPAGLEPERLLREILGADFYDKVFRLLDSRGNAGFESMSRGADALPLSPVARGNAERGRRTFETVRAPSGERLRVLTLPVVRNGQLTHIIQVGMPTARVEHTLVRFVEALLLLIAPALLLAAIGGAMIARAALRPVEEIAGIARRITAEDLTRRVPQRGTRDELDHLTATLNEMLARLDAAFAQLRRFAADAAHELRTPLTILRGGLEVALRNPRSAVEYERVLRSSLEEVERLARLAEDLLLFSRAAAGLEGARTPVDLQPLVVAVAELGVRLAQPRGVRVHVKEAAPVTVLGDGRALRRALLNLVENAVKYTPPGGTVEIGLGREDRWAVLAVTDTGPGIDPADLARVFEPFVRLDTARARETGGTGLGLAIAQAIVVAHGGTIGVDSTVGAGSTFRIRLPLSAEPSA
jgi:two-component system OmpR family sensor kinase